MAFSIEMRRSVPPWPSLAVPAVRSTVAPALALLYSTKSPPSPPSSVSLPAWPRKRLPSAPPSMESLKAVPVTRSMPESVSVPPQPSCARPVTRLTVTAEVGEGTLPAVKP